mmetsp:Transcript_11768/g.23759  ORF Transcript_11768/g.23759 Transcript_11768/m.23759 type:complete len:226 (+) Transcript_11768:619-1296(+)
MARRGQHSQLVQRRERPLCSRWRPGRLLPRSRHALVADVPAVRRAVERRIYLRAEAPLQGLLRQASAVVRRRAFAHRRLHVDQGRAEEGWRRAHPHRSRGQEPALHHEGIVQREAAGARLPRQVQDRGGGPGGRNRQEGEGQEEVRRLPVHRQADEKAQQDREHHRVQRQSRRHAAAFHGGLLQCSPARLRQQGLHPAAPRVVLQRETAPFLFVHVPCRPPCPLS